MLIRIDSSIKYIKKNINNINNIIIRRYKYNKKIELFILINRS